MYSVSFEPRSDCHAIDPLHDATSTHSSFHIKTEILGRLHKAKGIGVAHAAPPTLNTDDGIALGKHPELDRVHDTPLQAAVDVLLPGAGVEVGLGFVKVEGVHSAVQVGILF
jgi:hypothetical protein